MCTFERWSLAVAVLVHVSFERHAKELSVLVTMKMLIVLFDLHIHLISLRVLLYRACTSTSTKHCPKTLAIIAWLCWYHDSNIKPKQHEHEDAWRWRFRSVTNPTPNPLVVESLCVLMNIYTLNAWWFACPVLVHAAIERHAEEMRALTYFERRTHIQ